MVTYDFYCFLRYSAWQGTFRESCKNENTCNCFFRCRAQLDGNLLTLCKSTPSFACANYAQNNLSETKSEIYYTSQSETSSPPTSWQSVQLCQIFPLKDSLTCHLVVRQEIDFWTSRLSRKEKTLETRLPKSPQVLQSR